MLLCVAAALVLLVLLAVVVVYGHYVYATCANGNTHTQGTTLRVAAAGQV